MNGGVFSIYVVPVSRAGGVDSTKPMRCSPTSLRIPPEQVELCVTALARSGMATSQEGDCGLVPSLSQLCVQVHLLPAPIGLCVASVARRSRGWLEGSRPRHCRSPAATSTHLHPLLPLPAQAAAADEYWRVQRRQLAVSE